MTQQFYYKIDNTCSIEFENKTFYLKSGYPTKNEDGTYSDEDYAQAMANGLIIANEIKKASNQGFKIVILEKGDYFVCAKWEDYYYSKGSIQIEDVHDISINFNDSSIKLIYDSNNRNKYCTIGGSYTTPYLQRAWVIVLYNCTEVYIENLNLIGDAIDRSWVTNEEKMEQTYGITIGQLCRNIELNNIKSSYFMGDAITGSFGQYPYFTYKFTKWNVDKGIDSEGNLISVEPNGDIHSLVSEMFEFDSKYNSQFSTIPWDSSYREFAKKYSIKGFENILQFVPSVNTYTYKKDVYSWNIALYKKDTNGNFTLKRQGSAELFSLLDISYYDAIRIIINNDKIDFGEDDISTGIWEHNFYIHLSQVRSHNVKVSNSYIADNHRGGISNMPWNTSIIKTVFQNCGMDCGIGAPLFPDSTRYSIDQEEQYIDNLVIDSCKFNNGYNGCIINSKNISVINCEFVNVDGVSVNTCTQANISNNLFIGGSITSFENVVGWRGGSNMKSRIAAINNTIYTKTFNIYNVKRRSIEFIGCNIYTEKLNVYGNEDIRFLDSNIYLQGKRINYLDNKFRDILLENVTINSIGSKRSIYSNNLRGKFYLINTDIYTHSEKGEKTIFSGINMDENSIFSHSLNPSTVSYNMIIEDSVFSRQIEILPNSTTKNTSNLYLKNCEFKEKDKPLYVLSWENLSEKSLNIVATNCVFYGSKDNIFDKYSKGKVQLNVLFSGCTFLGNP